MEPSVYILRSGRLDVVDGRVGLLLFSLRHVACTCPFCSRFAIPVLIHFSSRLSLARVLRPALRLTSRSSSVLILRFISVTVASTLFCPVRLSGEKSGLIASRALCITAMTTACVARHASSVSALEYCPLSPRSATQRLRVCAAVSLLCSLPISPGPTPIPVLRRSGSHSRRAPRSQKCPGVRLAPRILPVRSVSPVLCSFPPLSHPHGAGDHPI